MTNERALVGSRGQERAVDGMPSTDKTVVLSVNNVTY